MKKMPKVPVSQLKPGMKLAKPVVAKNGMVMLGEATELTQTWIERIDDMGIASVFIDGPPVQTVSREDALSALDARFAPIEDKPYMKNLKKIVREHIEGLYE